MRRGEGVYAGDIRSKGPLTSDHRPLCLERPLILPEEGGKPGPAGSIGGQGKMPDFFLRECRASAGGVLWLICTPSS